MPVEASRIDHVSRLAGVAPEEPQAAAVRAAIEDASTPAVSLDLIEHLETIFRPTNPGVPESVDQAVASLGEVAKQVGHREVIAYLRAVFQSNQEKRL